MDNTGDRDVIRRIGFQLLPVLNEVTVKDVRIVRTARLECAEYLQHILELT
jgi:hypothetical protein